MIPEFSEIFQKFNSEYEVHQSSPNEEGEQISQIYNQKQMSKPKEDNKKLEKIKIIQNF
jgi:hypothetical protein